MAILVTDRRLEERLKAERELSGADRYDEVWEGIYMMTPMLNSEHQGIVMQLASILQEVIGWSGLGEVFPGINLTARDDDWEQDYRVPDVAVFLKSGSASNCDTHWRGGADFLVEITSPEDRTREKIPFYSRLGVCELLVVERHPWRLELYRHDSGELKEVNRSVPDSSHLLRSQSVPLTFQLVPGDPRPQIKVMHVDSGRQWMV
jgi:Uma2 family endonuclease